MDLRCKKRKKLTNLVTFTRLIVFTCMFNKCEFKVAGHDLIVVLIGYI